MSLHNSFNTLNNECTLLHEEAILEDQETFVDSLDLFNNISNSNKRIYI